MLEPPDRRRRHSTLFQLTNKGLRDFIDSNHLSIRIDGQLDFAKLAVPLEQRYCPDSGQPTVHPETMVVQALPICSFCNIASFRRSRSVFPGRTGFFCKPFCRGGYNWQSVHCSSHSCP